MNERIGFIISHPFQYQFYKSISNKIQNPIFIIEIRDETPFLFSDEFLSNLGGAVVQLDTKELLAVDGLIDVIFCMTPVHVLKLFKESKVIALQYSMAKEVYQYGPWRAVADLNLMHGPYSQEKVCGFCASEIVGNPRYDDVSVTEVGGGGVLYMPTYGELSSLPHFANALSSLPENLSIRVKLHHAMEFEDQQVIQKIESDSRVSIISGYENALSDIAHADIVISDYSGAIFDALYLDKPIILLQPEINQTIIRTNEESIEIACAHDIGPVLSNELDLHHAIKEALNQTNKWHEKRNELRKKIYAYEGRSSEKVIQSIEDLLSGKYKLNVAQRELRDKYIRYIEDNRKLRKQLSSTRKKLADSKKVIRDLEKQRKKSVFYSIIKATSGVIKRG